jgi:adenylate cyclase
MWRFLDGHVVLMVAPLAALAFTFWSGAFFSYLMERTRRREIRDLFASYVDPSVVSYLLRNPDSVDFGGQRLVATILYTDIEGFTSISEEMDPGALVSHLNEYFGAVTQAAIAAGGMHDKYVGDAVMVVFGFPIRHADHALRAVQAASGILREVELLNRDWKARGLPVLKTRIGICSGEVIIGSVGGTERKNFTTMGNAVNLASRLEGLNKRFGTEVLIAGSTAELLPSELPLKDLGEVTVRGVSKPVQVFQPLLEEM